MVYDEYFDVNSAVDYLFQGYIVVSLATKKEQISSFFVVKNNEIFYLNSKFSSPISKDDFLKEFADYKFSLVSDEQDGVDLKKDEEYYSWGRKL